MVGKSSAPGADQAAAAAYKVPAALGTVGLATASTAITVAVSDPPPGIHNSLYLLTVSGAFFAGVAQLSAAVWMLNGDPRARRAAGRKFMYASIALLAVAVGLSAATLFIR